MSKIILREDSSDYQPPKWDDTWMSKSMDEIIVTDVTCFHSERMSHNCYAIILDLADGTQPGVLVAEAKVIGNKVV